MMHSMSKHAHKDTDEELTDLDYESEAEGSGELTRAAERVKKLKAELEECKKERQEYLDGWQRLRADIANQKKSDGDVFVRAQSAARDRVLEDLLPVLDAFDMATKGDGWEAVPSSWRSGIEYVHAQLLSVLEQNDIQSFGEMGEQFDATLHEAASEEKGDAPGTILRVIRRGYRANGRIIRPAQVVVAA